MKHAFSKVISIIIRLLAYLVSTFVRLNIDRLLSTNLEIKVTDSDVRLTVLDKDNEILTIVKNVKEVANNDLHSHLS